MSAIYNCYEPAHGDSAFIGRQQLMRTLLNGVYASRSFALIGGAQTGRTSSLFQLMHLIYQRWKRVQQNTKLVPVYIDVAQFKGGPNSSLASELWEAISAAVVNPAVSGTTVTTAPKANFPKGVEADPWPHLNSLVEDLWTQLSGKTGWCEYLLLFDNSDLLTQPPYQEQLPLFSKFCLSDERGRPNAIVCAGGRILRDELYDFNSPFSFLRKSFLGQFNHGELQELCRQGFPKLRESQVVRLAEQTGGHPWVTQCLLMGCLQHGTLNAMDDVLYGMTADCYTLFEQIWQSFDMGRGITYRGAYAAPEHALMQHLLDVQTGCRLRSAERELGIKPLREFSEFLDYAGVIERAMRNDYFEIRANFSLWNTWYGQRINQ